MTKEEAAKLPGPSCLLPPPAPAAPWQDRRTGGPLPLQPCPRQGVLGAKPTTHYRRSAKFCLRFPDPQARNTFISEKNFTQRSTALHDTPLAPLPATTESNHKRPRAQHQKTHTFYRAEETLTAVQKTLRVLPKTSARLLSQRAHYRCPSVGRVWVCWHPSQKETRRPPFCSQVLPDMPHFPCTRFA